MLVNALAEARVIFTQFARLVPQNFVWARIKGFRTDYEFFSDIRTDVLSVDSFLRKRSKSSDRYTPAKLFHNSDNGA